MSKTKKTRINELARELEVKAQAILDILPKVGVIEQVTGHAIEVRPTLIGKASTFFQLLTVSMALVALHNAAWQIPLLRDASEILAGATVTISGLQYLSRALRWFNKQEEELSTTQSG